ncbi:MAG: 5-(carboxyamino)imidazole ribonucleotide synthase [Rhodospirillaceae bacterium]|nr:5-(carboxyamino)imidazole ribonucleotide synthase [Rhodospirillaceae bacterium]|tara:strand:+ start:286 stop:1389 length:1104 start_codon:yes stop_codon:yes gene_type:complete
MAECDIERLEPGSVIGILGGGQLGRMIAQAAAQLGYRCCIFSDVANSPAEHVSEKTIVAAYTDPSALDTFAASVDVVTLEFENIPEEPVKYLAEKVAVRPGPNVLATAQDRLIEKNFLNKIGIVTAPFESVADLEELEDAVQKVGRPSVLKTTRFGYDGKGQVKIDVDTRLGTAFSQMGKGPGILEGWVDYALEISVIVARGMDGEIVSYVPVENRHVNHILDTTIAPAGVSPGVAAGAGSIARRAAEALNVVGLLAVEMFVTWDGEILVNEIAPRPHNSGHWTIDACAISQFQQLVRAICGLPLGSAGRHSDAEMKNLIGDEVKVWPEILAEANARLHLYGKSEIRSGRKMGHVTRLKVRAGEGEG